MIEELELGRLVLGRKGAVTRFFWDESALSVAKAAKGESDQIPTDADDDNGEEREPEGSIIDSTGCAATTSSRPRCLTT